MHAELEQKMKSISSDGELFHVIHKWAGKRLSIHVSGIEESREKGYIGDQTVKRNKSYEGISYLPNDPCRAPVVSSSSNTVSMQYAENAKQAVLQDPIDEGMIMPAKKALKGSEAEGTEERPTEGELALTWKRPRNVGFTLKKNNGNMKVLSDNEWQVLSNYEEI